MARSRRSGRSGRVGRTSRWPSTRWRTSWLATSPVRPPSLLRARPRAQPCVLQCASDHLGVPVCACVFEQQVAPPSYSSEEPPRALTASCSIHSAAAASRVTHSTAAAPRSARSPAAPRPMHSAVARSTHLAVAPAHSARASTAAAASRFACGRTAQMGNHVRARPGAHICVQATTRCMVRMQ